MEKNSRMKEFRERFERHADELKWLYMELYHGDEQAYEYWDAHAHVRGASRGAAQARPRAPC